MQFSIYNRNYNDSKLVQLRRRVQRVRNFRNMCERLQNHHHRKHVRHIHLCPGRLLREFHKWLVLSERHEYLLRWPLCLGNVGMRNWNRNHSYDDNDNNRNDRNNDKLRKWDV